MSYFIVIAVLGIICILIGISNMRGNLATIHYYHRKRVSEADRLPFGRLMGLGTLIAGAAVIIFSIFSALDYFTENPIFTTIGVVFLIPGMTVGLVLSIYATIKYNKGLF